MHRSTRSTHAVATGLVVALALLGLAGCGGSDDEASNEAAATTSDGGSTTTSEVTLGGCRVGGEPLRVLIVNDVIDSPENDVFIDRLVDTDEIELDITVMAPSEEASGTSDSISASRVPFSETATPGGHKAYAVEGLPADTVIVALTQLDLEPHLVVAGVNHGHNFGSLASISSTMGVGRTAVRRDVPALTVSTGLEVEDGLLVAAAELSLDWVTENCDQLIAGEFQTDTVTSLNVPACDPEQLGELLTLPRAEVMPELPQGENIFESKCDLAESAPADDVTAVRSGYPTLTQVEPDI